MQTLRVDVCQGLIQGGKWNMRFVCVFIFITYLVITHRKTFSKTDSIKSKLQNALITIRKWCVLWIINFNYNLFLRVKNQKSFEEVWYGPVSALQIYILSAESMLLLEAHSPTRGRITQVSLTPLWTPAK